MTILKFDRERMLKKRVRRELKNGCISSYSSANALDRLFEAMAAQAAAELEHLMLGHGGHFLNCKCGEWEDRE